MNINIPGYNLEKEIGEGAMASVYLATQTSLARPVALKLMAPSLVSDKSFCERFITEGRLVARFAHRNVVTVHDIGNVNNHYYMAMEYLSGGTLSDRLDNPLPLEEAVRIVCEIAQALDFAEKQNIVHRDIKPANILFRDDDTPILSDFGIAKALDGRAQMTAAGTMMGTPNYMSPELALGKPAGHQSDLYSLGIVFYEMLTGRKPYQATDGFATALKHINEPIPELPAQYAFAQPLLNHWLAKDPADRIPNAKTLIDMLTNLEDDQGDTIVIARPSVQDDSTVIYSKSEKHREPWKPDVRFNWRWLIPVPIIFIVGALFLTGGEESTGPVDDNNPVVNNNTIPTIDEKPIKPPKELTSEEMKAVNQLLEAAEVHLAVKRVMTPPGGNAYEAYKQILEIDPNHDVAQQGMHAIAEYYFNRALVMRDNGNTEGAAEEVALGLKAQPKHQGLLVLETTLGKTSLPAF